jgi:hypothetical protein
MTFRTLKFLVPACAAVLIAGFAAAPANAAPLQKNAVIDSGNAQVTLVDQRDGRWRGDRGRDRDRGRHWRGRDDRLHWRNDYRPYAPRYRPPRYVYAPPAYYDPYYRYYDGYYPPSSGYFSYSSPSLGFSFGY